MKLIIDIDKETYIKAQAGILGSFSTIISSGKPYEERPQGEWLFVSRNCWKCPYCQELTNEGKNFCPNCGADMRGDT